MIPLPWCVTRYITFLADGGIGGNDTKEGGCFKNKVFAAGKVLGLLMVSTECLETTPGNVGATTEKTSAEDLGLEGIVFAMGSKSIPKCIMNFRDIIRSVAVNESETKTAKVIEADGEISKVKIVSDTILIGLPFADDKEYFSGSTSCTARLREETKAAGITSATEPLSGRTVILPFVVPS